MNEENYEKYLQRNLLLRYDHHILPNGYRSEHKYRSSHLPVE